MKYLATHENSTRGSFDFPVELYYIDNAHPRYEMPFHWHMECEIIEVIAGELSLNLNDNAYILRSGECMFLPSGIIHGGKPKECVYRCIVFSFEKLIGSSLARLKEYEQALGQGDYIPTKFNTDYRISCMFEALAQKKLGFEFVVGGVLWQIIGDIIAQRGGDFVPMHNSSDRRRIEKIKDVLRLIRNEYASPLTLQMFAEVAQLNIQYLCRSFKRITGKTPIEYLNYYRIECAAEYLLFGELNVTETAYACGFNDLSYFIKMFNRYKGVSPREYTRSTLAPLN